MRTTKTRPLRRRRRRPPRPNPSSVAANGQNRRRLRLGANAPEPRQALALGSLKLGVALHPASLPAGGRSPGATVVCSRSPIYVFNHADRGVHDAPIPVFTMPMWLFTLDRSGRSAWTEIRMQHARSRRWRPSQGVPEPGVNVDHLLLGRPRSAKSEMEVTTEGV